MISNEYKMHKILRVKTITYKNITFSSTGTGIKGNRGMSNV